MVMGSRARRRRAKRLKEIELNHPRFYFAYGSNLDVLQMQIRCVDCFPVIAGVLPASRLVFSGVLTVERDPQSSVPGAIYSVSPRDIMALDRYEGHPRLYSKRYTHATVDGQRVEVFYYVLNPEYSEIPPTDYYYNVVENGYTDWALDKSVLRAARIRAEKACPERQLWNLTVGREVPYLLARWDPIRGGYMTPVPGCPDEQKGLQSGYAERGTSGRPCYEEATL